MSLTIQKEMMAVAGAAISQKNPELPRLHTPAKENRKAVDPLDRIGAMFNDANSRQNPKFPNCSFSISSRSSSTQTVWKVKSLLAASLGLLAAVAQGVHADSVGDSSNSANEHVQFQIRRGEVPSRGVNLGSWLLAECRMSGKSQLWEGVPSEIAAKGEFSTMQHLGQEKGDAAFQKHWSTWITEQDFQEIASASLNTVRIPVGFWIRYDDPVLKHRELYYPKGSLQYLDLAIQWGEKHNVSVMLSLHAHQGSQNGFEHSAPMFRGESHWSENEAYVTNSVAFAKYLAARYASSPAFLGMSLMNELHLTTDPLIVQSYLKRAYAEIRDSVNQSDCVLAVAPMLNAQDSNELVNFMADAPGTAPRVLYNRLRSTSSETQIIDAAKSYKAASIDTWQGNPLFFGEWSMNAAIQFSSIDTFRAFGSAQLASYNSVRSGWMFWSWRHSDETTMRTGWSLRRLLKDGDLVL